MSEKIRDLYSTRFSGEETLAKKNKMWQTLCNHFFSKWLSDVAITCDGKYTIVDVAAGYCEFINNISADYKYAIDLNPDVVKFAASDVTAIVGTVNDIQDEIENGTVDAVFMSNFLEHLDSKEQISDVFARVKTLLKSGGRALVLQPNIKYIGGKYWDFFDHKLPLTENALIECAEIHGYKTIACIKKFLPYTTKSALPKAPWIIALYCKMMPLSGWFFGEQSFLVFEKQ